MRTSIPVLLLVVVAVGALPDHSKLRSHLSSLLHNNPERPWMKAGETPMQRATSLCESLSLDEKIVLLHGDPASPYVGNVPANTDKDIPAINMNDGPQGFRDDANPGTSTSLPSGLTIGATWCPEAAQLWGDVMGREFFQKGSNVQLGPGLNVARVQLNGRNFEYMSGEDPLLGATLVGPAVQAIQSHGVVANAKHYVNNNQETNRMTTSANIDERTQFEIYYPPFEAAIDAGVGSFMCSYNKINNTWSCENNGTLNVDLRDRLGFEGWVMSDWGATHSVSIDKGLDQEMPGGQYFGDALKSKVQSGDIDENLLDQSCRRIIAPLMQVGIFDYPNNNSITTNTTSPAHRAAARKLATEAIVLLTNEDNILPLSADVNIAVIGGPGVAPITSGGGSGSVTPSSVSRPLDAIRHHYSLPPITSNCSNARWDVGVDYMQPGSPSGAAVDVAGCCAMCAGRGDCSYFSFTQGKCYFKSSDRGREANKNVTSGTCFSNLSGCNSDGKCVNYAPSHLSGGVEIAKKADVAIVFVQTTSSEGGDRSSLSLDDDADAMIEAIAAVQKNTIVIAVSPGHIVMPWVSSVKAVMMALMPGQEYGNAVADLIFGDVSPSGRLPLTIPNMENEMKMSTSQYPGDNGGLEESYSEKLEVGYRWYNAHMIEPVACFGHGLTYSTFEYSNLRVTPRSMSANDGYLVSFDLENTGDRFAKEVAQVYVTYPSSAGEPPLQLRGFQKTPLAPGDIRRVVIPVGMRGLSVWDSVSHGWETVSGEFDVHVGGSVGDLKLKDKIVVL